MKYWIAQVLIVTLLLYNLLLNANYASADELVDSNVQQINTSIITDNKIEENQQEDLERSPELIVEKQRLNELFSLYAQSGSGEIYLELQPEQLNKNYLAIVTLESGIGEAGIYSGSPLANYLFYFRRVRNQLHFVVRNVKFRAEPNQPEQRSLIRSFSDSVLYSLPIQTLDIPTENIFINLNHLLMTDFPGLTPLLKHHLQADYRLDKSKSYFGAIKSFPENVEIDAIYGFSSIEGANLVTVPDSRSLSLKVHYSFSQLPENNGYIPRLADDRVGYFITAFQDFSNSHTQEPFVRYINRWHLEPSDSNAPVSTPKQPIVFWIENAVPQQYRQAIQEGVLMWNQAFVKAGWQNAIAVQQMPDNANWQPADVRYNTIRWFNSLDAGFAKGPVRTNPLTGQILDADIIIDANLVRSVEQEYHTLISDDSLCFGGQEAGGRRQEAIIGYSPDFFTDIPTPLHPQIPCHSQYTSEPAAMGALALSLLQHAQPSSEAMQEYVHQYLRYLVAHEVGHTLGLRHNFHGSTMLAPEELNNTEITQVKGLVGSVMDYLPVNIAPQGVKQGEYFPSVIGPYDEWAIAYGYEHSPYPVEEMITPEAEKSFLQQIALASPQPELSYATDEDIWDINPLANVWDLSSDVLVYSQWQMDNAHVMWERLDEHYLPRGESYSHLRAVFNKLLTYYFRNANLLSQYIGGQSFRRLHATDDSAWAFVPVPLQKQRQALEKLQTYVFAEDAFSFSPQLLNQLAPSRWQHWGSFVPNNRLDYPIHENILSYQRLILRSLLDGERLNRLRDIELKSPTGEALSLPELFETLQKGIWTEVLTPEKPRMISSIRRGLQQEHLKILLEMLVNPDDVPEDGRTIAWYELRQLQTAINNQIKRFATELDIYTLAHLEFASDRITKAL